MLNSRVSSEEETSITGLLSRVYIPPDGSKGKPLVVLVHGRAGNSEVMWIFSKALEAIKPVVVSPQGFIPDIKDGWSWWPIHDKLSADASAALRAERLNEVKVGVERVRDFIERCHEHFGTDRTRTYMAGFSQGAALCATLSLMEPEKVKGVGILSGFIPYAVIGEPGLVRAEVREGKAKLPEYFIFHGEDDPVLPIARGIEAKDWLEKVGASVEFHQDKVTHKVSAPGIRALGEWFTRVIK